MPWADIENFGICVTGSIQLPGCGQKPPGRLEGARPSEAPASFHWLDGAWWLHPGVQIPGLSRMPRPQPVSLAMAQLSTRFAAPCHTAAPCKREKVGTVCDIE